MAEPPLGHAKFVLLGYDKRYMAERYNALIRRFVALLEAEVLGNIGESDWPQFADEAISEKVLTRLDGVIFEYCVVAAKSLLPFSIR